MHGRNVDAAVSAEQALMSHSQEWEAVEIVLVVDFHTLGETGAGITRGDQADQHTIDVDLITVRRTSATDTAAVGKAGIDGCVNREDVARGAVCNRDRPVQVDRL